MDQLIQLMIVVLFFCIIGWLGFYICDRAKFPDPVRWIFGGILLIFLLYFISGQIGAGSSHPLHLFGR